MVHVLVAKPHESRLPVIYNVDAVVGAAPAANLPDDVVLVKAFFKKIGDTPLNFPSEVVDACKAIVINTTSDAALVTAIRAFQNDVKTKKGSASMVVDGRVSRSRTAPGCRNQNESRHARGDTAHAPAFGSEATRDRLARRRPAVGRSDPAQSSIARVNELPSPVSSLGVLKLGRQLNLGVNQAAARFHLRAD